MKTKPLAVTKLYPISTSIAFCLVLTISAQMARASDGTFVAHDGTQSSQGRRARVRALGRSKAKGWSGLVPLRSTRQQVEAVIGKPTTPGGSSYQTASERVFVQYSDGPCERGWPFGWNVVRNTVVMISIAPKNSMTLADLGLDESKYEKWSDRHIDGEIHYTDHTEGIHIQVDEPLGKVLSVSYMPSAADEHLRCPAASRRLPPGRSQADSFFKLDTYGDVPATQEHERLDSMATEMERQPDTVGYIIAYAGMSARTGEAKARANRARAYVIKKHHLNRERILAIDGGYREAREVELYVEPREGPVPLAAPSVRPSKVTIIEAKKRPASRSPNFANTEARAIGSLSTRQTHARRARLKDVQIHFSFDPTDPTREKKEESAILVVRRGGAAEAVLYDRDRSAIVATYKGLLSKAYLERLAARVSKAIREANSRRVDDTIVRESDLFYVSIKFENGKVEEAGGKVEDMPEVVRVLVRDLNLLWRRFKETPRAAAYLKTKSIDKETLASLQQKGDVHFASIGDFPLDLRQIIEEAINQPQGFHPLSQARYDELRRQQRLVIYNGSAYVLKLFQSHHSNHVESQVEGIRFSFHPRWREEVQDDVFLTIQADGRAEVVFNDYDGSKITRIYKGTLPKAEVYRLSARIRAALREANKPKTRNGVIREGDLFYLSVTLKNGAVEQSGGVVAGVPEVHSIVEELRVLWKRLKKTPLADAYLKTTPIENDRLALLLKEGKLRFIPFRDFPNELQPLIRKAINKSFGFQALNQIQYDQLKTYASYGELYITDGETGYKLTLLLSQRQANRTQTQQRLVVYEVWLRAKPLQNHTGILVRNNTNGSFAGALLRWQGQNYWTKQNREAWSGSGETFRIVRN